MTSTDTTNSPISKVTWDVLGYIFLLHATDVMVEGYHRAFTIASISRVCKQWRYIVQDYPMLWTHVINFFGPPSKIEKVLQLSGNSPLAFGSRYSTLVFCYGKLDEGYAALNLMLKHTSRLQSINFCTQANVRDWSLLESGLADASTPLLKFIELSIAPGERPILVSLFNNNIPSLQTLRLHSCIPKVLPPPSFWKNLKELQINGWDEHPSTPTVSQWVSILGETTQLRWLVLEHSIRSSHEVHPTPIVSLNQLRMIQVTSTLDICALLMQSLYIPASCSARLSCRAVKKGEDQRSLFSWIQQRFSTPGLVPYNEWFMRYNQAEHAISFQNLDRNKVIIRNVDPLDWERGKFGKYPILDLSLILSPTEQDRMPQLFSWLLDIFSPHYPSATLLQLVLSEPEEDSLPLKLFQKHLSSFQALQRLSLHVNPLQTLLTAPPSPNTNGPGSESPTIELPSLSKIEFTVCDLRDPTPTWLFEFVRWRHSIGSPIQEICVYESTIDKTLFENEIGGIVTLDLEDGYDTNSDSSEEWPAFDDDTDSDSPEMSTSDDEDDEDA